MLFNATEFIFLFLPITLILFFWLGSHRGVRPAIAWLVAASLFFYGYFKPAYLLLIGASIVCNYLLGLAIDKLKRDGKQKTAKWVMIAGVVANLGSIALFKYADFIIANVNSLAGTSTPELGLLLPLAISFFTFQQIAYLADAYSNDVVERNFLDYTLFVTFFPQLIAGPIVHHTEMLPQFKQPGIGKINGENIAVGLSIFSLGLFKKVIIADNIATFSDPVFAAALAGESLTFLEAWVGALGYTVQLYFDFSGYSDMAIGLARMFGILLPLNFNSPYKAVNISDFWRRWHMTLSRFLRDYLYIALGGNRAGQARRYINLAATMILGGLWHGAGWTFIIWGALHGSYLVINHAWQWFCGSVMGFSGESTWYGRATARLATFMAVVIAWVFFRAESLDAAMLVLSGLVGGDGFVIPAHWQMYFGPAAPWVQAIGFEFGELNYLNRISALPLIALCIGIAFWMPNTQQIMHRYDPALMTDKKQRIEAAINLLSWRPSLPWVFALSIMAAWAMFGSTTTSQFLYFNF